MNAMSEIASQVMFVVREIRVASPSRQTSYLLPASVRPLTRTRPVPHFVADSVEANHRPLLTVSERPKNIWVGLYCNLLKAPHIVPAPLAKLVVDWMPIRLDSKEPGSVVLLDRDLQRTANHTSSKTVPQLGH
jgi:hypothetical protein